MSLLIFGMVLPWLLVGFGCWLGYQLIRQNGRILLQLETLERRLSQMGAAQGGGNAPAMPPGLPIGSSAPEFDLPDLSGGRKSLAGFRGKRLLLVFFNPGCGFCARMAPDLAALPTDGRDGRPIPVVVTAGGAEANRKLVEEHRIRCPVLLQENGEMAQAYLASGTPTGYLIDEEGRIASGLAVGAQALLDLFRAPFPIFEEGTLGTNGHREYRGNRSLADSRIARNGLTAGTPAPEFTLPRLEGGEVSLGAYRGRKVLLVFSDPNCGPCNALMPQLEEAHRRSGDVQVLVVSRGDVEANQVKAKEHGISFPVALQRQWEISRQYAMFATPVAYLIDEEGIIAADVASGAEAILALVSGATEPQLSGRRA